MFRMIRNAVAVRVHGGAVMAQDQQESAMEAVVAVGSQQRGAQIGRTGRDSIIGRRDINALGVPSGDGQPDSVPAPGFAVLIGQDGNPRHKVGFGLGLDRSGRGASVTGRRRDDFFQVPSDVRSRPIPPVTSCNFNVDHGQRVFGVGVRVRPGTNGLTNEGARRADNCFGFFAHRCRDLGRYHDVDLRADLTG